MAPPDEERSAHGLLETHLGRRRPSGEPPPLPRQISRATAICATLGVALVPLWVALSTRPGVRLVTDLDLTVVHLVERTRSAALTDVVEVLLLLGSAVVFRLITWLTLVVLVVFRRFQELVTVLALLLLVPVTNLWVSVTLGRMRPAGVEALGSWAGYSHPAGPIVNLSLALTIAVVMLVPRGRWRARAGVLSALTVGVLLLARSYAGLDHPTDAAAALALGSALPLVALRLLAPEAAFPVSYVRGVRAHLDVSGTRGAAICAALAAQVGVRVSEVQPFSLSDSAGSTPLRLRTVEPDGQLFGKLYASTHLWSDRWYKLARTVRYGRLEDERPFNTVRRLVQYEDHMLRVMRDAGVPTAAPVGIVEITPEREYVLVTELLDGAVPLTHAVVTERVVDEALRAVRTMWDAGLAHRDVKPANILVRDERVWLIDVAFAEIRPTPWRQAVDLANMLLSLALRGDPEQVYARALLQFTPDEVAEALAASRAVTVPAQLRTLLRTDGRDLEARFRALAPARAPVSIQRWTLRRAGLTLVLFVAALMAIALVVTNLELAGLL
jgi:tRNA A-37 threonylcarbamoyl transferase component Bud32